MSVGELRISRLEQLPCPRCGEYLERGKGRHGLVWLCRACHAGAVTVPVLRKAAPRAFVNQVWQAALHDGRPSRARCPACEQPFTEFRGARGIAHPQIKVCVRCYWVWFSPELLAALASGPTASIVLDGPRALLPDADRAESKVAPAEARRVLGVLGADALMHAIRKRRRVS